jgi:hypothetical protein
MGHTVVLAVDQGKPPAVLVVAGGEAELDEDLLVCSSTACPG